MTDTVPAECQPIADEIADLRAERTALQEDLQVAAPGQKPFLVRDIRRLNAQITARQAELDLCLSRFMEPPTPPRATCPIPWQPSVLAPVFYGVRDYPSKAGRSACRVFFPSIDGAVFDAPILEGCGRYPLILFAHGNCAETNHYQKWFEVPAQLARSGYVVAVPELPVTAQGGYPWAGEQHPDLQRLADLAAWMRESWEHRAQVLPAPATGVVGHSYGALLGARIAADAPISAFASLSGTWSEWPADPPRPIRALMIPKLFTWGGGGDAVSRLNGGLWGSVPAPKHSAVFDGGEHWDYLPAGRTTCARERGPCDLVGVVSRDLLAAFFGKYLPPEDWPDLGGRVPESLIPPPLRLTPEQQFFAGGHLLGVNLLASRTGCRVTLAWETAAGIGGSITPP